MNTEFNKKTLQDALAQLPAYDPPAMLWEQMERALEADQAIAADARLLPQYEPPDELWGTIETGLDQQQPLRKARRISIWSVMSAAAAFALLISAGWWLFSRNGETEQVAIVVTQEVLDTAVQDVVRETQPDTSEIAMLDELCATKAPVCESPEFQELKNNLDELTRAKQELHEAIGQYGDDPELAQQLVQIERERSQLLQEIMSMI